MADDLDKKMEPEISDAAEKVVEAVKEEAAVVEAVEEKAAETVAATAAAVTASAAADKAAAKEAEAAAKAAKKAEEQAAKDAAKQKAAAEKARIAKEKAEAKLEKKRQKKAAQQALIDACPPQYRPVSTSKYFWLAFLSVLPVLGFIITLVLAIIGRNRNIKNFEKAILAYYIIAFILCLIGVLVVGIILPAEIRSNVLLALEQIIGSIKFG